MMVTRHVYQRQFAVVEGECPDPLIPIEEDIGSISAVFSSPVFDPPEKGGERGLISRTAAGYRA